MQLINYNFEAHIPFETDSVEKTLMLCEQAIENITADKDARFKLKSVIHELLVNSLEHGYNRRAGKIYINLKKDKDCIYFEIRDEGSGFDPSNIDLDRRIESIEAAPSRGWGLMIISKYAKELRITKNLPQGTKVSLCIPVKA